jgi:hypothetical protein
MLFIFIRPPPTTSSATGTVGVTRTAEREIPAGREEKRREEKRREEKRREEKRREEKRREEKRRDMQNKNTCSYTQKF